jgi:hypothetical protein
LATQFDEEMQPMNARKTTQPAGADIQVLYRDEALAIGFWERHFISIWRQEISSQGVAILSRHMAEVLKQHPGQRIHSVTYLEPACLFEGSPGTFQASVEMLKRFENSIAAVATVYNREGFWSAAMRGRFTAIFSESTANVRNALFPTLPEALLWLAQYGAPDIAAQPELLAKQVEALRTA